MVRALFIEYPEDRTSWLIEDEYLFGRDILVAPLMEETERRDVYLPPGHWVDFQNPSQVYGGERWHSIGAGEIPCIILVRDGAIIPQAPLAQSTGDIDWSAVRTPVYAAAATSADGLICFPDDGDLIRIRMERDWDGWRLS